MTNEKENVTVRNEGRRGGLRRPFGVVVAAGGLFWLAKKSGWMPIEHSHAAIFWPLVVIAAGLFLFFSSRHEHAK